MYRMMSTGAAAATTAAAPPVQELAILERSKQLILQTLYGLLLELQAIDGQRAALLQGEQAQPCADPGALGILSSLLFVTSTQGFYAQSRAAEAKTGAAADHLESCLSGTALSLALIRLARLLCPQDTATLPEPAQLTAADDPLL